MRLHGVSLAIECKDRITFNAMVEHDGDALAQKLTSQYHRSMQGRSLETLPEDVVGWECALVRE